MRSYAIVLLLLAARSVGAVTYWIDASKAGGAGCGITSDANACNNWHQLIQQQGTTLNNSVTADTVNVVAGTYHGNGNNSCWEIRTAARTAGNELVIQCTNSAGTYAPGTCTVDNSGVTVGSNKGLIGIAQNDCGSGDGGLAAHYLQWKGINVTGVGSQTAGNLMHLKGNGANTCDHILIKDSLLDGGPSIGSDLFITDNNQSFVSQVNVTVTNCGMGGSYGCNAYQRSNHIAIVGSSFGPARVFPNIPLGSASNRDAVSIIGTDTVLEDGNTAWGMPDGPDHSMLDINKTGHVIARYWDIRDIIGASTQASNSYNDHHLKISGDDPTITATNPLTFYKNVLRFTNALYWNGGFWTTEQARDVDFWYNTIYCPWHRSQSEQTNSCITLTPGSGGNAGPFLYSIFDGPDTQPGTATSGGSFPMEVCPFGSTNCSASAMRWVGNGLWFNERGGSAGCTRFNIAGDNANFNCDLTRIGGGAGFNSTGNNSGNVRADPAFLARSTSNQTLAGLQLTGSSGTYLDAGGAFCTADAGGTAATSVVVTCGAAAGGAAVFNDPKHYFPDPNDYYGVANGDCLAKGVRAIDAGGGGCFDLQIAGGSAGKREVTSIVTATRTINFTPAATWSAGAMVHVPWSGTAPDRGAAERLSSGTSTTTAPATTSTTATTATTTTSTTGTTLAATQHIR